MHRRLQFDMRENPASDRRHGSRLVVSTHPSRNSVRGEDPQASSTAPAAEAEVACRFSPKHGAPRKTATAEEREETYASVSPVCKPEQVSAGVAFQSSVGFEPLLDVAEAARLLRMHPRTLRTKARDRIVPAVQVGRRWRFRASALNDWLGKLAH